MKYVLRVALLLGSATAPAPARAGQPYSFCRLLADEEKKCAFGSCDKRVIERLRKGGHR